MADQVFDPSKPFTVVEPPPPAFDPSKPFEEVSAAPAGGAMNFAIVNGVRVPIADPDPAEPMTALRKAETIGAAHPGDVYMDRPLSVMNLREAIGHIMNPFGGLRERTAGAKQVQPDEYKLWAEGKGPIPFLPAAMEAPTPAGGINFTGFIKNLTANRRHRVGLDLLSDALNIKKAGQITEPEFHTALARLHVTHTPENPIRFGDEIAQRAREVSHDMDEHVKGIADQFRHVNVPTEPLRDIARAGASNPIGGGGPGSTFVQSGRGAVLRLYPQLGHYEPVLNAQGQRVGSRLVSDPVSIPDAATILKSVNKQLNDRLGPQAARRVRTDMLATDPTYAALDALATSLRRGIDEGLESVGVPGIKAFRQDQAAVIKLQQVAEKVEGKGDQKISRLAKPSATRQLASDLAPSVGTMAGAEMGGPGGALAGKTVGEAVRNRLTPSLTRDQAVAKAYRLMKPAPNLSFPMMPAHTPGAGPAQAAGPAASAPGAPPGGAAAPGPSVTSWPIVPATGLNPRPPDRIGTGTDFVVDPTGRVRSAVKAGPQIAADAVWPRPAMAEGYRAPKNDPSFVRAVKGVYAKVFKRAEAPARPGNQPLSTPAPAGPQRGGIPAPSAPRPAGTRSRFVEARAEATRLRDETLDTLTARYVEAGHPDPPAQIRAKLREDLDSIEQLHHDAAVDEGGGTALLKAIAKHGGISIKAETAQKGEIAWLKEFRDGDELAGVRGVFRDLSRNSADAKRMNMQRQVMGKGERSVPFGGLSLDGMLEALKQEGRFQNLTSINDLNAAIEKAARAGSESAADRKARALTDLVYHSERDIAGRGNPGPDDDAGFAAFADAVDELAAEPIVDTLPTGEGQPRLPGAGVAGKGGSSTSMRAPQQATGEDFALGQNERRKTPGRPPAGISERRHGELLDLFGGTQGKPTASAASKPYRNEVLHITTPEGEAGIRGQGFDVNKRGGLGGDDYGPGVYVADYQRDMGAFWRQQLETKNFEGIVETSAMRGDVELKTPFHYQYIKYNKVGDNIGRISPRQAIESQRPDLIAAFDRAVESGLKERQALGKVLRENGYDGLVIEHYAGDEIVAFSADRVTWHPPKGKH